MKHRVLIGNDLGNPRATMVCGKEIYVPRQLKSGDYVRRDRRDGDVVCSDCERGGRGGLVKVEVSLDAEDVNHVLDWARGKDLTFDGMLTALISVYARALEDCRG